MSIDNKEKAYLAKEIARHKGTMDRINDIKFIGNGAHYVGDYLGWSIWVYVEGYRSRNPRKRIKYIYLQKDMEMFHISWILKLGERFLKKDITTFCERWYEES